MSTSAGTFPQAKIFKIEFFFANNTLICYLVLGTGELPCAVLESHVLKLLETKAMLIITISNKKYPKNPRSPSGGAKMICQILL